MGWFGFNAGSALASDGLAGAAMLNTQVAAATAALAWMACEVVYRRKATLLGLASGAVAGLVAITPAAGFVNPGGALIIGALGGAAAFGGAVFLKRRLGYDDSLDVFGVHGVAGSVGALLTGVLADAAINSAGEDGSILTQLYGVAVTYVYCGVVTLVILLALDRTLGLRVAREEEIEGLDGVLHGETVQ